MSHCAKAGDRSASLLHSPTPTGSRRARGKPGVRARLLGSAGPIPRERRHAVRRERGKIVRAGIDAEDGDPCSGGGRLGWDYWYETRIAAEGPFQSGVIDGNLVVIGSGDPSIERPTVESWAGQLRALGIARITGDVIADSRAFAGNGLGAGWSWDDLPYSYAAPVSAAQFHESTVDLTLTPGREPGDPVSEELTPTGSGLTVENAMRTGPSGSPVEFAAHRLPGSAVVVLEGSVPAGGQPIARALAVGDPAGFWLAR